jgi:hypothetical protein
MTTEPDNDTDNHNITDCPYASIEHLFDEAATNTFEKQLDHAVSQASHAFWKAIGEELPQVSAGDFPPPAQDRFWKEMRRAAIIWVALNTKSS